MSRNQLARHDFWQRVIAQQQQSGLSVAAYCQRQGTTEQSFYYWRKRLAQQLPVKFALVEPSRGATATTVELEVMLSSGDRLRIAPGADISTLRVVLNVLREQQ
jgi:transposase-like protein